jgi:TrmH RNA methyltransferase
VYGLSAARSVLERRPQSVISIAHTPEVRRAIADMLREAARRRIAYREVDEAELSRMADSVHHEGVCVLVKPQPALDLAQLLQGVADHALLLALDGVQNPHNVGAILRTAAYFGVSALLLADAERSLLTAAARRVAEGGAEVVPVLHVAALGPALRTLAEAQFVVVGADARAKVALPALRWPKRAVLVLGHEQHGLSAEARKVCKTLVGIPGSAAIESLNVSVAAGIFMASYAAAHGAAT